MEYTKMQLHDWLDDLCVRFIINLPEEELQSVERICFQVEEAQWFYEDFIRPLDPSLPSLNLRQFCLLIFQHCPLFAHYSQDHFVAAFSTFLAYKTRVPVRGAILLNEDMDEAVLVKGWKKGANWSFPRGKINKDEPDIDCAVREVYEETGFDIAAAGLVLEPSKQKYIEVTMREQQIKLFVFRGVPKDTVFQPRTRKEISKIEWYKLSKLPGWHKKKNQHLQQVVESEDGTVPASKLYMVAPFLGPLKKWIMLQKKQDIRLSSNFDHEAISEGPPLEDYLNQDQPLSLDPSSIDIIPATIDTQILSEQMSIHDPATELKRLLSIGTKPATNVNEVHELDISADLLAMLRQGHAKSQAIPQPVGNQMDFFASAGQAPRYEASPQASSSKMPSLVSSSPSVHKIPGLNMPTVPNARNPYNTTHTVQFPFQNPAERLATTPMPSQFYQRQFPQSNMPQQNHPYYSPTSETQVPGPTHSFNQVTASVPAAADLPAPKLSRHAQSLLDAFKIGVSSTTSGTGTGQQPGTVPRKSLQAENSHAQNLLRVMRNNESQQIPRTQNPHSISEEPLSNARTQNILDALRAKPSHHVARGNSQQVDTVQSSMQALNRAQNNSKQRQFDNKRTDGERLNTSTLQPPFVEPASIAPSNPSTISTADITITAPKAVNPTAHQDSLLKLFRTPSVPHRPTDRSTGFDKPPAPSPVELSAMPSPGIASSSLALSSTDQTRAQETLLNPPLPAIVSKSQSSGPTSATISGPQNLPDLGVIKRKARPTKIAAESTVKDQKLATPIQILKRPVEERPKKLSPLGLTEKPVSSPSRVVDRPRMEPSPKTTPKPFHPQILKRPAQTSAHDASRANSATPPTASAGMNSPAEHKQALLSLFNKTTNAKTYSSASEKSTTDAPTSARLANSAIPQPIGSEIQKSRVNSLRSETMSPIADAHRQGDNIAAPARRSEPERRGSSTPISPSDKGFLLSYLEGVVKSAGR